MNTSENGKVYISGNKLFADSFKLAKMIEQAGWVPDLLLIIWRGGAPVGITIHEYLAYRGHNIVNRVITCRSYIGLDAGETLDIDIPPAVLDLLHPGLKVLLIDDIFDTGRTAMGVKSVLRTHGTQVRVATLYWKPSKNKTSGRPDYYLQTIERWVVFPHELEGLSLSEIATKMERTDCDVCQQSADLS